jgi:hypothetical protein
LPGKPVSGLALMFLVVRRRIIWMRASSSSNSKGFTHVIVGALADAAHLSLVSPLAVSMMTGTRAQSVALAISRRW